jgi:uncharacterized protein (DUF3820 family)
MQNFILKFGKYKGQNFSNTPKNYQDWLLQQDWFKMPTQLTELQQAQKSISNLSNQLKGWNGHNKKGADTYDRLFEAEQAMDNAIFNSNDQYSSLWNGEDTYSY